MNMGSVIVTFMNGPADGRSVTMHTPSVTIGHDPESNDVSIDFDPQVEKTHLEILFHEGHWEMVDHSNGKVYVGGARLTGRAPLTPDTMVLLGNTLLKISISEAA